MSSKKKNGIIETNIDLSKITHQKHNSIKHLAKATEMNKNSNLSEEVTKSVIHHDLKKEFYQCNNYYNFF